MDSKLIRVLVLSKNSTVPVPDLRIDRQLDKYHDCGMLGGKASIYVSGRFIVHTRILVVSPEETLYLFFGRYDICRNMNYRLA